MTITTGKAVTTSGTYRMSDDTIVKPKNATECWEEDTRWDGHNHVSLATGEQFSHQTLFRSRKGRFYVEHTSQWQDSTPHAEWVSNEEAARWILSQGHKLPPDLTDLENDLTE